jgi:hypothetical protein
VEAGGKVGVCPGRMRGRTRAIHRPPPRASSAPLANAGRTGLGAPVARGGGRGGYGAGRGGRWEGRGGAGGGRGGASGRGVSVAGFALPMPPRLPTALSSAVRDTQGYGGRDSGRGGAAGGGGGGGYGYGGSGGAGGGRGGRFGDGRRPRRYINPLAREPSVRIGADWLLVETAEFGQLNKLASAEPEAEVRGRGGGEGRLVRPYLHGALHPPPPNRPPSPRRRTSSGWAPCRRTTRRWSA